MFSFNMFGAMLTLLVHKAETIIFILVLWQRNHQQGENGYTRKIYGLQEKQPC